MIAGTWKKLPDTISFTEFVNLYRLWELPWGVERINPFSLEVLAAVKTAICGVNLEKLRLPRMIKEDVKKYQDLHDSIKSYYANLYAYDRYRNQQENKV